MDTSRPLRWGILSTAAIASELLPAYSRSLGNELVAVASRDADRAMRFAGAHGIPRWFGSYEGLLVDEEIDAVYLPLPNSLHVQWARAALAAGKHVLCEKPLALTAADAQDLFELAVANDLVLTEAFMYRHHPKTLRVRELVRDDAIGDLRTIRCSFNFRVSDPERDIRYSETLGGGALRDVGCYCVSYATFVTGEQPERVLGLARRAPSGVDERFHGLLAFPSGAVAQFDCGLDTALNLGATLVGSEGEIHVPMPWYAHRDPLAVYVRKGEQVTEVATPGENAYLLEIEDLAATVTGERQQEIAPSETIRNLRVIEALRASAGLE